MFSAEISHWPTRDNSCYVTDRSWCFGSWLIGQTVSNFLDSLGATFKVILYIETVGRESDRVPILDES